MNFDRLAPHYDWMEAVTAGARLQRARTHWLDALAGCHNVLSVGEGHGRFAAAFLARFPHAKLTCVEASPGMIEVGQRRTHACRERVRWECAEVLAWQPREKYDAIVTCFFLDCFPAETLAQVVDHLAGAGERKVVWLVTDFLLPNSGLSRLRARAVHALMYSFFRVAVDLPARRLTPPARLLQDHGFKLQSRHDSEWGLLRTDFWRRG